MDFGIYFIKMETNIQKRRISILLKRHNILKNKRWQIAAK